MALDEGMIGAPVAMTANDARSRSGARLTAESAPILTRLDELAGELIEAREDRGGLRREAGAGTAAGVVCGHRDRGADHAFVECHERDLRVE